VTPVLPPPTRQGKVRDIYDLGDQLLLVTTDKISAFDYVLQSTIPHKGEVLTQLSLFWFNHLSDGENPIPNHLISSNINDLAEQYVPVANYLAGRFMLVKKAKPFPVECIVRGRLTPSLQDELSQNNTLHGVPIEKLTCGKSPDQVFPLFTPSTKAEVGDHDINISLDQMIDLVGADHTNQLRDLSIDIFKRAARHCASRDITLIDTKFEFGLIENSDGSSQITLIDEVLTPDSSRFQVVDSTGGSPNECFDKQFVRDWLLNDSGWSPDLGTAPPPLPAEIIKATSAKYIQAYERITGQPFVPAARQASQGDA